MMFPKFDAKDAVVAFLIALVATAVVALRYGIVDVCFVDAVLDFSYTLGSLVAIILLIYAIARRRLRKLYPAILAVLIFSIAAWSIILDPFAMCEFQSVPYLY